MKRARFGPAGQLEEDHRGEEDQREGQHQHRAPADGVVRQPAGERDRDKRHRLGGGVDRQGARRRSIDAEAAREGGQEHQREVVGHAVAPGEDHGQDHRARRFGERLLQRQFALFVFTDRLRLVTGMGQSRAHPVGEDRQAAAADEGQAPDPCQLGVRLQQHHGNGGQAGREQVAAGRADIGEAAGNAAPAAGRRLDQVGHRAGEFAADRESLEQADQQQQDRRPDADLGVGRQEADRGRGRAHHHHGHDQHGLPADRGRPDGRAPHRRSGARQNRWRSRHRRRSGKRPGWRRGRTGLAITGAR